MTTKQQIKKAFIAVYGDKRDFEFSLRKLDKIEKDDTNTDCRYISFFFDKFAGVYFTNKKEALSYFSEMKKDFKNTPECSKELEYMNDIIIPEMFNDEN